MRLRELLPLSETRVSSAVKLGTKLWRYITSRLQVKKQISLDIPNPRDPVWEEIYYLSLQHQKAGSPEQAQKIEQKLVRMLNGNQAAKDIVTSDRFHREIGPINENLASSFAAFSRLINRVRKFKNIPTSLGYRHADLEHASELIQILDKMPSGRVESVLAAKNIKYQDLKKLIDDIETFQLNKTDPAFLKSKEYKIIQKRATDTHALASKAYNSVKRTKDIDKILEAAYIISSVAFAVIVGTSLSKHYASGKQD